MLPVQFWKGFSGYFPPFYSREIKVNFVMAAETFSGLVADEGDEIGNNLEITEAGAETRLVAKRRQPLADGVLGKAAAVD